jgi:hypothetical protein
MSVELYLKEGLKSKELRGKRAPGKSSGDIHPFSDKN